MQVFDRLPEDFELPINNECDELLVVAMALQNNAIIFTKDGDESDVNRIRFRNKETQKALKILEKKTYKSCL